MFKHIKPLLLLVAIAIWFAGILPRPLFDAPFSTLVYSAEGQLLSARIAADGQWRSPAADSLPAKFVTCLTTFEDKYFRYHPGVNPVSLLRAVWLNAKYTRIVSGGSTITMQVIRLSRQQRPRTLAEKLTECVLATRLELSTTKNEILSLYVTHAPFGGNIVGLTMASQRYFGRPPHLLSWAECAMLAVLPNAPSLIHPGRNRHLLLSKRNRLLSRLYEQGKISNEDYQLALDEPLPDAPFPIPNVAPHLLNRLEQTGHRGHSVTTSLDDRLQHLVTQLLANYMARLRGNYIFNGAALLAHIETGEALAYVGNDVNTKVLGVYGQDVDIITSLRSPGSLLKPLLYTAAGESGELLPAMLLPDIPIAIGGYTPKNYNNQYDGAVPAWQALSRSLNIPAVMLMREYGTDRFYDFLKKSGISSLNRPASHYGLSLVLGGAECTPWDIAGAYASLGRTLLHFNHHQHWYYRADTRPLTILPYQKQRSDSSRTPFLAGAGPIWQTFHAMLEVNKPETEAGWEYYLSARQIAWKTGTSFGFRDAWAVGLSRDFVVLVWIGNADGRGRPELSGVNTAAPLLFEVFRLLPASTWYEQPYSDMKKVGTCRHSGLLPGPDCPKIDSVWVADRESHSLTCTYHRRLHLNQLGHYQVTGDCYPTSQMVHKPWFVLPPLMETYYQRKNASYIPPPPFLEGCNNTPETDMTFVYPWDNTTIFVPRVARGEREKCVFEVTHRRPEAIVYWHINGQFVGETRQIHQLMADPPEGEHTVTAVDERGSRVSRNFKSVRPKN